MSTTWSGWTRRPNELCLLVDRCLSPEMAAAVNLADGLRVASLADAYGDKIAQALQDVDFLEAAGRHGWGVLTQNVRMWRTPPERTVIEAHGVRVFCLASSQLTRQGQGLVVGRHLLSIRRRLTRGGACFWRIHANGKVTDLR